MHGNNHLEKCTNPEHTVEIDILKNRNGKNLLETGKT